MKILWKLDFVGWKKFCNADWEKFLFGSTVVFQIKQSNINKEENVLLSTFIFVWFYFSFSVVLCGILFTFLKNTLLHMISEKHQSHSKRKPSPVSEILIPLKVVSFAIFFLDLVK